MPIPKTWDLNKMADILQAIISNAFYGKYLGVNLPYHNGMALYQEIVSKPALKILPHNFTNLSMYG